MFQRPLEQPDLELAPDFKELRAEMINAMYAESEHDVVDEVIGDIAERLPEILARWAATRILSTSYADRLDFGTFMDELIEDELNKNCLVYSS